MKLPDLQEIAQLPDREIFTTLGQLEILRAALTAKVLGAGQSRILADPPPTIQQAAKPYLTVKEAADLARLAPSTVRLYIRKRQLKAQKVGRRVIIKRSDLERFLEAYPIEALANKLLFP